MDEVFSIFIEVFGQPINHQVVPAESIKRYKGKLPNQLLTYWAEHGWCGYGEGIFWTVNPEEYEGVVASWLEGTAFGRHDSYHLIARGAFGALYLWGEKTGPSIKIDSVFSRCLIHDICSDGEDMDKMLQNFLLANELEYNDLDGMFKRAKKKLGALKHDEMYGFVPALMLGGPDTLDHLEKLKSVEHLMLLSQLSELKPYSFSDL